MNVQENVEYFKKVHTSSSVIRNAMAKLNGCADNGTIALRKESPCTTILYIRNQHPNKDLFYQN